MRITKPILSAITLAACLTPFIVNAFSFGDIVQQVAEKVAVDQAAKAIGDAVSGEQNSESEQASATAAQDLSSAPPIKATPLNVRLETTRGKTAIFKKRPKIAVVGYNIGSTQTAKISGSTYSGQGASANMSLKLNGVDSQLLQRVANAGHEDLVKQLKKAGIDTIPAPKVFNSKVAASEIKRHNKTVDGEMMDGRAPKDLIMVGPSNVGAVTSLGLVSEGFAIVGSKTSVDLDAVVIYPNVALDFAWTSGGGTSIFNKKVSVEGGMRFALDSTSKTEVVYSKKGLLDDWATLGLKEDIGVDDLFATMDKVKNTNNSGSVGLSNALGFGMSSRNSSGYDVNADPKRYEQLAMNAVKGFNRSLVEKIKSAKAN